MLQDVIDLARDNNVILHKIIRAQRWASFWRIFYWVVVIGAIVVGYYWAQPYLSPFVSFFSGQDFAKILNAVHTLPSTVPNK